MDHGTVYGFDLPAHSGGRDRKHPQKWLCVYLLPMGAQTAVTNGMKFGVGAGIDRRMVRGWV